MSQFNRNVTVAKTAPITTTSRVAVNHQGGLGFERDAKSELFLLAASYLEGERFYGDQEQRLYTLVRQLAVAEPLWTSSLIKWLRDGANLRTVSLISALEFVKARLDSKSPEIQLAEVGINRLTVHNALKRPDEPGEALAYWLGKYGRSVPKPVKRAIADAARQMYTEKAYLKWDSSSASVRFSDVIELTHANHRARNPLYKYILDERHHKDGNPEGLPVISKRLALFNMDKGDRAAWLQRAEAASELEEAGMTWEMLSSWLGRPLRANEWAAILPSMGLMAVIRNARNMDQAGVSDTDLKPVFERLADEEEIRRSRMMPFRFLSAYRHSSLRWHYPLEKALRISLSNVPALKGRTLVLVDRSGSMDCSTSKNTEMTFSDTAALFGSAIALRAEKADLVEFGTSSQAIAFNKTDSPLQLVSKFHGMGGTNTAQAVRKHFNGHDRVIIITDEQTSPYGSGPGGAIPATTPMYTWNLAGYRWGHAPAGTANRFTSGGLSDQSFKLIPILEGASKGVWPWQ